LTKIDRKTFDQIERIVYRESGIVLKDKQELVESRIASLCRKKGYDGPADFLIHLKKDKGGSVLIELLDKMSTNLTYFFREPAHFKFLADVFLPELMAKKKKRGSDKIRIWCAACSSGEEPYSLAMVVRDSWNDIDSWDFKILGTDISTRMLREASLGEYSRADLQKVPPAMTQRYFTRSGNRHEQVYKISDEIRRMVVFQRLNLLGESFPFSGLFDLIVCRNVMIYFDQATKESLLGTFHRYMLDGACLFTGHAESISGYHHLFKRVQVAVYKK